MNIIDQLEQQMKRLMESEAELARILGLTVEELDEDTTQADPGGEDDD